jgi:hypothetical protein
MAEGTGGTVTVTTRDEQAVDELAASRREMVAAVTRQIAYYVELMEMAPEEASARARACLSEEPDARGADQVSWHDLANLIEHDAERGQAAWQRLKDEAAQELAMGVRTARSLERPVTSWPYQRAQFIAVLDGLRASLAPRDGLETLLVQQMASALELNLRWQQIVVQRMETEVWQGERDKRRALESMSPAQRERYQQMEGWLPPRLAESDALEQAVLMADRYQRAFLRLLKAFRDNRRQFEALIVAGGQVNIGERQVNVHQGPP